MINFILIGVSITVLYLFITLVTFNPADPGWLQTIWHGSIHNVGGILGAKLSDFLFFIFGAPAYIIPLFILFYLWRVYAQNIRVTVLIFLFKLIGILILLFACCGLAHLTINNFFYFSSGGMAGSILYDFISSYENITYNVSIIVFLLIVIIDIAIFFNKFFLVILKTIKKQLYSYLYYLNRLVFYNKKCQSQFNHQKLCAERHMHPLVFFVQDCNFIKNLFSRVKLYISKKNYDFFQKKHMNSKFFNEKNYFIKINKHNERVCSFYNICGLEKKEQQHNVSLLQDLNTASINHYNHKQKMPIFVKKNIKKRVSLFKYKQIPMIHRTENYDNRSVVFPDINLLTRSNSENITDYLELNQISKLLEIKLSEYHIIANVVNIVPGPVITRFELNLSPGIKSSTISNLSRDLARVLYTTSVKVVDVIPGTPYVGLEIPNKKRSTVYLGDIVSSDKFRNIDTPLALVLGQDISGQPLVVDLRSMPHLLVAGTTGSGKSMGINTMIIGILYKATPEEVRFIMIDPKILELSIYSGIPHLLKQVITDMKEVHEVLQWCINEMERRYNLMAMLGVRNLENYNSHIEQLYSSNKHTTNTIFNEYAKNNTIFFSDTSKKLPYIIIIIDEFSDLMITTTKQVEELVIRLTQKARAAGIHVILATQRPSVDVITGVIKANIPARIAFTVSSKIDSRTILGQSGAESLLGMGDMLYLGPNSPIYTRVHGAFIEDKEIRAVVDFWKTKELV